MQAELLGPRPALRFRQNGLFHDVTWADYREQAMACAAGLVAAGVMMGDRVGLLAENRVEWLVADMGIMTAGAANVPAHAALPAGAVAKQLIDAGVNWLFLSNAAQVEKYQAMRAELPGIKGVVVFDRSAAAPGIQSWDGFLQQGRQALSGISAELERREKSLGTEDLATLMYTSGTTGVPKGVMLSHGNLLSNVEALFALDLFDSNSMVLLSWLPYSHIFARLCDHYLHLRTGSVMALADSLDTVPVDIQLVQPTHLHGVPRFFEKMLAAAQAAPTPEEANKRLKYMFGRRLMWAMSGGAPLPPAVGAAYHAAGVPLLQGYGLTETSPVLTTNIPTSFRHESAGKAIPGVELKIADDGEILARGPNIMKGYWNQPQATAAVMQGDWFATGDVGRIDSEGFLYITGRKKDLLVLSNGKKVSPSEVEALLQAEPCIEQAVIYGEKRSFLTALVVPNWARVRQELKVQGTDDELARSSAVNDLLRSRINQALAGAVHWEQVKQFVIRSQPFSVQTGELTVSLKLRREVVFQKHAAELEAAYRKGGDGE
jgi:long-chain acyl-CoA synthetase